MSPIARPEDVPFLRRILHPTDFSPESEDAFAHALAIALFRQGELTLLHASDEYLEGEEWQRFPSVRETLERWKLLEPGSPPTALSEQLGIRVNKLNPVGDPVEACVEHLADYGADLIVLATEGRRGLPRWVRESLAEKLVRETMTNTLFVPHGSRGFVSRDGDVGLRRILVPVVQEPDPTAALVYATRAAILAGDGPVELVALHVGDEMPPLALPAAEGCSWRSELRRGDAADEIVRAAEELPADVILMSTNGRSSLAEAVRGSHTERVLRRAPCVVFAVSEA